VAQRLRVLAAGLPAQLHYGGVEWRPADVTDPEADRDAAKGAPVIYQCLNAPSSGWPP